MAIGKKTGGKDFQKGHLSKGGRPKLSDLEVQARELAREKLANSWIRVSDFKYKDIIALVKPDKSLTVKEKKLKEEMDFFDLLLIGILAHGAKRGEFREVDGYLSRLIGKPSQPVEGKVGVNISFGEEEADL